MPSDPTRDALLAAIVAEPEDDVPRLVFADWCEDHGDAARAEFIRVQCRLAGMNPWDEGYVEAKLREQRLFWENREEWSAPLQEVGGRIGAYRWGLYEFRRGFPDVFELSEETRAEVGALLARLPLTRARYYHHSAFASTASEQLLGLPELARLRELWLKGLGIQMPERVDAVCVAVATLLHFANLRRLVLPEEPPTPAALAGLLAAPHLAGLTGLEVWGQHDDSHARSLAAADLPSLRELRLGRRLTPAGAATLAAASWLPRLAHLDLTANEGLGDAGLEALLAGRLEGLRSLRLWNCHLGARAWAALAQSGPAALVELRLGMNIAGGPDGLPALGRGAYRLEWLDLSSGTGHCREDDLARLLTGAALGRLRRLEWSAGPLWEGGFDPLIDSPLPDSLRLLMLNASVSDDAIRRLCDGPPWPHLAHLVLGGSKPVSPATALELLEHPNFARVVSLALPFVEPAHVFVKQLAASPAAARLRSLQLPFRLTPGAVKALLASPHLDGLDALMVSASQADLERLRGRFGERLLSSAVSL
jgi:uncharacterized protein (TIGR02996 family)